jgi:2-phosphosulfolactate phosphatase
MMLEVHFLPELVSPTHLEGGHVAVVDVLRASTTIVTALFSGCSGILPVADVDEAKVVAYGLTKASLLGGERNGTAPPGFDLGNSPGEYTRDRVFGRDIVFSTTNGTRAIDRCRFARRVSVAAFVNRRALVDAILRGDHWHVLCAGTDGAVSEEDCLFAGSVVLGLFACGWRGELNDEARLCHDAWFSGLPQIDTPGGLASRLRGTRGGRRVIEIGQEADIAAAADIDRYSGLPELERDDCGCWLRLPDYSAMR